MASFLLLLLAKNHNRYRCEVSLVARIKNRSIFRLLSAPVNSEGNKMSRAIQGSPSMGGQNMGYPGPDGILPFLSKKFSRNFLDYGFRTSFMKTMQFLIKPAYHQKEFILYELNLNAADCTCGNGEYSFHVLRQCDTGWINQIERMEEWLQGELRNRLRTNGICMVVVKEDKVAGFNLATVGEGIIPLLRLRVITAPDEAWSLQITIAREHRQKGLGSELRKRFYSELAVRGIKALYGHRQIWNIASENSARKYTSNELVRAKYLRVFNYQRLKYCGKKPPVVKCEASPNQTSPIVHTVYPGQTPRKDIIFSLNISDLKIRKEIPKWI